MLHIITTWAYTLTKYENLNILVLLVYRMKFNITAIILRIEHEEDALLKRQNLSKENINCHSHELYSFENCVSSDKLWQNYLKLIINYIST